MIDALSRRASAIVVFTMTASLLLAWVGAPVWMPKTLAIVVAGLAALLFVGRGGRRPGRGSSDRRTWVAWELAGKGTPPGSYLLGFVSFVTIMLTGIQSPYAMPAWAGLALAVVWGIVNRDYPADEGGDL